MLFRILSFPPLNASALPLFNYIKYEYFYYFSFHIPFVCSVLGYNLISYIIFSHNDISINRCRLWIWPSNEEYNYRLHIYIFFLFLLHLEWSTLNEIQCEPEVVELFIIRPKKQIVNGSKGWFFAYLVNIQLQSVTFSLIFCKMHTSTRDLKKRGLSSTNYLTIVLRKTLIRYQFYLNIRRVAVNL